MTAIYHALNKQLVFGGEGRGRGRERTEKDLLSSNKDTEKPIPKKSIYNLVLIYHAQMTA